MNEHDDLVADLLAVIVAGRPDPFVDVGLAEAPPAVHAEMSAVREAFAVIAHALPTASPSPGLKSRIASSLALLDVAPSRALLVLDMLNDHLTPGRPLEVPRARDIVPSVASRLDAARRDKTPVVYVVDRHDPSDADLEFWGTHNLANSEGAEIWPAIAPRPGDFVVPKCTYSAFTRSNLGELLSSLRVDTLVLTGCLTEIGILATATDALQRGYMVEVPQDAQAGATQQTEQFAMGLLGILAPYGAARRELLEALHAAAAL